MAQLTQSLAASDFRESPRVQLVVSSVPVTLLERLAPRSHRLTISHEYDDQNISGTDHSKALVKATPTRIDFDLGFHYILDKGNKRRGNVSISER
jgi:hypothetical protein